MQIIENKHLIDKDIGDDRNEIQERCNRWKTWHGNPMNLWDWHHPKYFQDDSGV